MLRIVVEFGIKTSVADAIEKINNEVNGKGYIIEAMKVEKVDMLNKRIIVDVTETNTGFKTSKFTGVYWNKTANKWMWQISHNGKRYKGSCDSELECAVAYDSKALELRGPGAITNFKRGEMNGNN